MDTHPNDNPIMSEKDRELVLCVPRAVASRYFKGPNGFTPGDTWGLKEILRNGSFVARGQCETDPQLKQLIPYVLIRCGERLFVYNRSKKSGEGRLVGKASIGIGGHVNPDDGSNAHILSTAMERELSEEVLVVASRLGEPRFLGFVNNEDDAVGQVHLGLVFLLGVTDERVTTHDPALVDPRWENASELWHIAGDCERWSQILISQNIVQAIL